MASPCVLSTWSFGTIANAAAWPILSRGGAALDAVIAGATAVEDDPKVDSVGTGGLPDAGGELSLDASVMTDPANCGSVCYLRHYPNPAQLARRVMEKTIHVMLAGDGAEDFARRQGFARRETLTPHARAAWEKWQREGGSIHGAEREGWLPPMNVEERYRAARLGGASPDPSHDTVCVLAKDAAGQLAGVCTTSGLGFKVPGRVGDSPIIGHGLYVEQSVGAASATGNGELIMGVCGSFLAVEEMRRGKSPMEAIQEVLRRVAASYTLKADHQVALIALRADGAWASGSLRKGFSHCYTDAAGVRPEPGQFTAIL